MLRCGVIGCGRIMLEGHVPSLQKLGDIIEVVAASDPSGPQRQALGKKLGIPSERLYPSHQEMLSRESLDFVDIATPHFTHCDLVLDSAKAGVNILLEKPMATSLEEADRMVEATRKAGITFGVIHNYLYSATIATVLRMVREGVIGKPFLIRDEGLGGGHYPGASGYDPDWRTKRARAGGGCLLDNGYHNIYLSRAILGPVRRVMALVGTRLHPIDVEDTALVLLEHEGGGFTNLQVAWSCRGRARGVQEIHGTEGSLSLRGEEKPLAHYAPGAQEPTYPELSTIERGGFEGVLYDFAQALQNGTLPPTTGEEARENLRIVLAAYEASRTGKAV